MHASGILTRFSSARSATKAGVLTAALMALTAGAGFANELPAPAQEVFNEVFDIEDEDANFGEGVSADATGESDGEPGVDGRAVACVASEGKAAHCEDAESEDGDDEDDGNEANDFGERVSADATGESDGEPGVDGEEISAEARERAAQNAETDDEDDEDDGEGRPEDAGPQGTPGEDRGGRPSDG